MKESDQPLENFWLYENEAMWPSILCQNTTEMDFLQSLTKELLTYNKFPIKSVRMYLVSKMCHFFLATLIKKNTVDKVKSILVC